jgi:hypothetical protein
MQPGGTSILWASLIVSSPADPSYDYVSPPGFGPPLESEAFCDESFRRLESGGTKLPYHGWPGDERK